MKGYFSILPEYFSQYPCRILTTHTQGVLGLYFQFLVCVPHVLFQSVMRTMAALVLLRDPRTECRVSILVRAVRVKHRPQRAAFAKSLPCVWIFGHFQFVLHFCSFVFFLLTPKVSRALHLYFTSCKKKKNAVKLQTCFPKCWHSIHEKRNAKHKICHKNAHMC